VLKKDGSLDRRELAKVIFKDQKNRKRLERITHPQIISTMKKDIAGYKKKPAWSCSRLRCFLRPKWKRWQILS